MISLPVYRSASFIKHSLHASLALSLMLLSLPAVGQEIEAGNTIPTPLQKADEMLRQGRNQSAKSIIDAYLAQNPYNAQALIRKAKIDAQNGQFPQAESHLNKAYSKAPYNLDVLNALAYLYYQESTTAIHPKNRLDQADALLDKALSMNPEHVPSLTTRGLIRLEQNDFVSAEQLFRQAINANPTDYKALQGLTRFYIKTKDWTNARYTISQALEIQPKSQDSYFLAAQLLAIADFPEDSVQYALKSEALDFGKNLDRDYLLATQYEKLGEAEKAIPYHQRVLKAHPKFAPSWQRLGQLYATVGKANESKQSYQVATKLDPNWLNTLKEQVLQTFRQGATQQAISQMQRVMQIEPEMARIYQPLIANIAYSAAFSAAPKAQLPFEALPISSEQSFDAMKLTLGKIGYSAGFVLPGPSNGTQLLNQVNGDAVTVSESHFLAGNFSQAKTALDENADSLSGDEYGLVGDRLMLIKHYDGARTAYNRALDVYKMEGTPQNSLAVQSIGKSLQTIDRQTKESGRLVIEGNQAFDGKRYEEALTSYLNAIRVYPSNDSAYLRLADTFGRVKIKKESTLGVTKENLPLLKHWAYYQATQLNPALTDSKGFNKTYSKAIPKKPNAK